MFPADPYEIALAAILVIGFLIWRMSATLFRSLQGGTRSGGHQRQRQVVRALPRDSIPPEANAVPPDQPLGTPTDPPPPDREVTEENVQQAAETPDERKKRLMRDWRHHIQVAIARTKMYRPQLGDARPLLEDYGLTLGETLEGRIALYRECFDLFEEAQGKYHREYYQRYGRVPLQHTPGQLLTMEGKTILDEPLPPRLEDFWLTPEDLQPASETSTESGNGM